MKILLDTNIIIHREASSVVHDEVGVLFRWIDNLHYRKCVHPISVKELNRYRDPKTRKTINLKLENYNVLKTTAPLSDEVKKLSDNIDKCQNDINDTIILNELFSSRVDIIITEDKKLRQKAASLGILEKVFTIDAFLEKVSAENPEFADYKILSVNKEYFGNIDISQPFFASLKEDYLGFEKWFSKKADETAYICSSDKNLMAFLYLKVENEGENYSDIDPPFPPNKKLKIGTMKVALNGFRLGERFIKIVFDNALRFHVKEIYVTLYKESIEQERLVNLLEDLGFYLHGYKSNVTGKEYVYVRHLTKTAERTSPRLTYPFISISGKIFIVPIYPQYHTELFPDSILNNESPFSFIENEPYRNAISKVYISRSIERNLNSGDIIVFYRTGGYYKGVVTTIGIVENVIDNINSEKDFIELCRKRSVFSDTELSEHWNYKKSNRPFVVNFLYSYSFPKRINMKRLIEMGVIPDINSAPRGFECLTKNKFIDILRECQADESIVVD